MKMDFSLPPTDIGHGATKRHLLAQLMGGWWWWSSFLATQFRRFTSTSIILQRSEHAKATWCTHSQVKHRTILLLPSSPRGRGQKDTQDSRTQGQSSPHLLSQLTGGSQHHGLGGLQLDVDLLQDGDGKGGRLACAGLSLCNDVIACGDRLEEH